MGAAIASALRHEARGLRYVWEVRRKLLTDMWKLIEVAPQLGLDPAVLRELRGEGEWEDFPVPERLRRGSTMWAYAAKTYADPSFPIRLASFWEPDDVGALGLAMRTAPTLGAAWDRFVHYQALFFPMPMWERRTDGALVRFSLVWCPPLEPLALRVSLEFLVGIFATLSARLVGERVALSEVAFRHEAPSASLPTHAEALGVVPQFGASWTGLVLSSRELERPVLRRDPVVSELVIGELEALRGRELPSDARLLVEQLRTTVRAQLPDGPPPIDRVARTLGMSERTLRRRLRELDTTYADVVEQTREHVARELLRGSPHSLAEVAYLLGFSEPSAFHRAFKRWTGLTPTEFRQQSA